MIFFETLRNRVFWSMDFLKGGKMLRHFKEIKYIYENYHSDKSNTLRKQNLDDLLSHAISTTPFYKSYKNYKSLQDFPVIDKSLIKDNFEKFKSESYLLEKSFKVASSGSTGTPFVLYQDIEKRRRNIADTIFFAKLSGYNLGQKLVFMRVWTDQNRKGRLSSWAQNIKMQNVSNLKDDKISEFINWLVNDKSKKGILSYASTLEAICKYLDKTKSKPLNCNLSSIISNSEGLNEYTKESIEKYFKIPVVSRYSNAENGIFAQQNLIERYAFDVNWGSYFFEILKFDEDVAVKAGDVGRIVITDLFNYCMPIIRYDTGDIGSIDINHKGIPVFKQVEGRRQDIVYNTNGDLISSFVIGGIMKKYNSLKQFQFIQETKKDYLFKLNTEKKFSYENRLIEEFKEVMGSDSSIKIEYIDEIPPLASGKQRQVVNNYNKD
ncbi:CoF synthetase [Flavivirga spongiicola]|uniref:CoF synthetase n=1 Tax=Flavivirga spongiicola TaxID=421621 RepID=A0ABU7XY99_9FLAO|nr:CoF synthetase [Flavivirga sp. MEBiC05379]MDO5980415.1 CoF synthetase [Flavivirga sp. MEBiC05379]